MAKIERINTDGTNRVTLIQTGLQWPNGLTHDGKHLYWADAHFDKIEMSDFNVSLFNVLQYSELYATYLMKVCQEIGLRIRSVSQLNESQERTCVQACGA